MKKLQFNLMFLITFILFFVSIASALIIIQVMDTEAEFNEGIYNETFYNSSGFVQLNATYNNGIYTSKIMDQLSTLTWKNISWQGSLIGELPNNKEVENKEGGANMTGNILLMHLDEAAGNIIDYSGEGNNGTYNGVLYSRAGKINTAIGFDGSDDYINCGNVGNESYDSMTISTWFNASSFAPARWRTMLHRNDGTSVGSSVFFIGLVSGTNQIVATIGSGSMGNDYMAGATGVVAQVDKWYHVVNSWNGTTATIYVNGIEKGSYLMSAATFNNKVANTKIGSSGFGSGYLFNGIIDETAIWDRSLSAEEILDNYKRGALELNLSVQNCSLANCGDGVWLDVEDISPQDLNLVGRYMQFKFNFNTLNVDYSPKLYNVTTVYSTFSCDDGIKNQDETDVDCGGICGAVCNDGEMCGDEFDCLNDYCEGGVCVSCSDGVKNHNESDIDCGGLYCSDCSDGLNCSLASDCSSGYCENDICVSCSDGIINHNESDVDCGGLYCSSCGDGLNCSLASDCSSGYCENNICVSCSDGVKNNNETDIDCGGLYCSRCGVGKNCIYFSDCGGASTSCSVGICCSCSDGFLNQGEDLVDCGGSYCTACEYLPYLYDDCGNATNETHLFQGNDFTFVAGVNVSLPMPEKTVSYHSGQVIYRYPVNNKYDYKVKIKLLQPTGEGRIQDILADSFVLESLLGVPEYNSLEYVYDVPFSSYGNDSSFDLIFRKISGTNAVCSEIEVWKSTASSESIEERVATFDFDIPSEYTYDNSEIIVENSSAKIYGSLTQDLWETISKIHFDEGNYNETFYNSSGFVQLNVTYNSGIYFSKIFDATGDSIWHNISWLKGGPYQKELPDNRQIETQWIDGNADMTGNVLLMYLNNDSAYGENNTHTYDFSGNGNNGTWNGDATPDADSGPTNTGKLNGAFMFDGNVDIINCGNDSSLIVSGNTTISAWVRIDALGGYQGIYTGSSSATPRRGMVLGKWIDDRLTFFVGQNSAAYWVVHSTNPVVAGAWNHVVGKVEDGVMYIYVNGVQQTDTQTGVTLYTSNTDEDQLIGRWYTNAAGTALTGAVDELAIWDRSLSSDEILDIYKRGSLRLNLSVRSCNDFLCSGENFVDINDSSPQNLNILDNRFFQYKFNFSTDNSFYSPELYNVTVDYTADRTPSSSVIETQDLTVSDLVEWINVTMYDNGEFILYNYSIDSGAIWNAIPLGGNLSGVSISTGKIRFKGNLTSNATIYDIDVSYYAESDETEEGNGGDSPRRGGGNGGNGGSGGGGNCTTEWFCTDWSECINGTKTRICTKIDSNCDAGIKPSESEKCRLFESSPEEEEFLEKESLGYLIYGLIITFLSLVIFFVVRFFGGAKIIKIFLTKIALLLEHKLFLLILFTVPIIGFLVLRKTSITGYAISAQNVIHTTWNGFIFIFMIGLLAFFVLTKRNKIRISVGRAKQKLQKKYPSNSVTGLVGKKIYSSSGDFIGEVKDVFLEKNKIDSLKIGFDKKIKNKKEIKGVIIKYKEVSSVGEIVIIKCTVIRQI